MNDKMCFIPGGIVGVGRGDAVAGLDILLILGLNTMWGLIVGLESWVIFLVITTLFNTIIKRKIKYLQWKDSEVEITQFYVKLSSQVVHEFPSQVPLFSAFY